MTHNNNNNIIAWAKETGKKLRLSTYDMTGEEGWLPLVYVNNDAGAVNKAKNEEQTTGGSMKTLIGTEWTPCVKLPIVVHVREQREGESHVSTREGITPVRHDDLIMRGVEGEEYPIGRALFDKTYTFTVYKHQERQPLNTQSGGTLCTSKTNAPQQSAQGATHEQ